MTRSPTEILVPTGPRCGRRLKLTEDLLTALGELEAMAREADLERVIFPATPSEPA